MKIAIIVQRYGTEITGGSELHARWVAERLNNLHEVQVLTTCAFDYSTWKNYYDAGTAEINGVKVHRFHNSFTRNMELFNQYSEYIFSNPHDYFDGLRWMMLQGPHCPELLTYLKKHDSRYDVFIFFTYLYFTTYYGLQLVPGRSLLVPTVHDEAPLDLDIFKSFFHLPRGFLFNTNWEKKFIQDKFHNEYIPGKIAGVGIQKPQNINPNRFKKKFNIKTDYILYLGRIEEGKGCKTLVNHFNQFLSDYPGINVELVLAGKTYMDINESPGIRILGYLDEEDKFDAIDSASIIIIPSPLESLSILLLEAFSRQKPVLANGYCQVLKSHCLDSNGGLYYTNYGEFARCLKMLLEDPELRSTLGKQGYDYQQKLYNWNQIMDTYELMLSLARFTGSPTK